jgi:hypothetical protein
VWGVACAYPGHSSCGQHSLHADCLQLTALGRQLVSAAQLPAGTPAHPPPNTRPSPLTPRLYPLHCIACLPILAPAEEHPVWILPQGRHHHRDGPFRRRLRPLLRPAGHRNGARHCRQLGAGALQLSCAIISFDVLRTHAWWYGDGSELSNSSRCPALPGRTCRLPLLVWLSSAPAAT